MTPQEKKAHSLKKDWRNTYGENDKSSRKSIRFRKRWVNRTFRREANQTIDSSQVDAVQDHVAKVQKKNWKKSPDTPLGQKLLREQTWALERDLQQASQADPRLIDDLHEYLTQYDLGTSRFRTIMRRARAITLAPCSSSLDLDSHDLAILAKFLQQHPHGNTSSSSS